MNQTWTSNNSPYRVVGNILVAGLTIKPGVTVLFTNNYAFEVAGKLTANGTPSAPIVFTGTNGGWQGIFFNAASPACVLADCVIANSVNSGVRIISSTPSISACVISNNSASCSGAGISSDSPLALSECSIIKNRVSCVSGKGAGIYSTAPLALTDCSVSGNVIIATAPGSAAYSDGAGIWCSANVTLESCLVVGNSGSVSCPGYSPQSWAGGIDCGAILTVRNSIISSNSTSTVSNPGPSPSYAYGGGVRTAQLLATNTIFDHNSSYAAGAGSSPTHGGYSQGAAIYVTTAAQVVNCTIAYNTATASGSPPVPQGGGVFSSASASSSVQFLNSILWGNTPDQIYGPVSTKYCDVQNGQSGNGNITGNPVFLGSDNLIIVSGSPCVNAGNTNSIYKNIYFPPSLGHTRNDMGAHGGPGAGARFRYRLIGQQFETRLLGCVPGYTYLIQGSTNLLDWQTINQVQIAHLRDVAYYIEPSTNSLPWRFYKLNLAP